MRILIVDDEHLARSRLRDLIAEHAAGEIVGEAGNGAEALAVAQQTEPDVVLLDIRMPGMDGLEAALHMTRLARPPAVIFTTAYGDHALDAFQARAVDYLLKPIRKERLIEALERARQLSRKQLSSIATTSGKPLSRTHISATRAGTIDLVPVTDILYFEAEQKYVTVRHRHGTTLIEDTLKILEDEFTDRFLRIHRKYLVATACLSGIEKGPDGHFAVTLRGFDGRLPVSRRQIADVRQALKSLGSRLA
ncbi:MAG: two-component system, LytT family, response regulator AlgR [Gammaproteobacteria bacterium]|nr:MAG: two-component system, LytT family, response regulator AlgR [Gammaproteobacteria bacterium]